MPARCAPAAGEDTHTHTPGDGGCKLAGSPRTWACATAMTPRAPASLTTTSGAGAPHRSERSSSQTARRHRLALLLEEISPSGTDREVCRIAPMARIAQKVTYGAMTREAVSTWREVGFGVPT